MKRRRAIRAVKFALPARRAASRFSSRCQVAGARAGGWRAVSLSWRRKPKTPRDLHAGGTTLLSTVWAPRLHLHFSVQAGDKAHRALAAKNSVPNTPRPVHQEFLVNRYQTNVRALAAAGHAPRVYRPLSILYQQSRLAPAAPLLDRSRPQPATPLLPPLMASRVLLFQEHRRTRVVSQSERTFATRTLSLKISKHQHHIQELRFRTGVRSGMLPLHSHSGAQPTPRVTRPAEIVWRRAPQPSVSVMEGRSALEASTVAPSGVRPRRSTEPAAEDQTISAAPIQVRPANLDSGFIDRLTDDVICRVEKRIRIERERRGL